MLAPSLQYARGLTPGPGGVEALQEGGHGQCTGFTDAQGLQSALR